MIMMLMVIRIIFEEIFKMRQPTSREMKAMAIRAMGNEGVATPTSHDFFPRRSSCSHNRVVRSRMVISISFGREKSSVIKTRELMMRKMVRRGVKSKLPKKVMRDNGIPQFTRMGIAAIVTTS
jgi:hypothetical protein